MMSFISMCILGAVRPRLLHCGPPAHCFGVASAQVRKEARGSRAKQAPAEAFQDILAACDRCRHVLHSRCDQGMGPPTTAFSSASHRADVPGKIADSIGPVVQGSG